MLSSYQVLFIKFNSFGQKEKSSLRFSGSHTVTYGTEPRDLDHRRNRLRREKKRFFSHTLSLAGDALPGPRMDRWRSSQRHTVCVCRAVPAWGGLQVKAAEYERRLSSLAVPSVLM